MMDRDAMNALYGDLRRATEGPVFGVPRGVVKAYVQARAAHGDIRDACARAHFGCDLAELGPGGRECVLGWAARLAEVEARRGTRAAA